MPTPYDSVGIVIQARMGSRRLPGKVLLPINNFPLVGHVLVHSRMSGYPVCLATTDTRSDDVLCQFAEQHQFSYFRGSETNVLERIIQAAHFMRKTTVVRVTADCLGINGQFIRMLVLAHMMSPEKHYTSNCHPERLVPRGFDIEVCALSALEAILNDNPTAAEMEHVTLGLYTRFPSQVLQVRCPVDVPDGIYCIDTLDDYRHVLDQLHNSKDVDCGWRQEVLRKLLG